MDYNIKIDDKFKILNEVIEDLPIDIIRQIKINYDAKLISIIFLEALKDITKNKKIIFKDLKYYHYEMQDIYYLISKIANIFLILNNYKFNYFPNYKKDGYNIFINLTMMFDLYMEDDNITIEYIK